MENIFARRGPAQTNARTVGYVSSKTSGSMPVKLWAILGVAVCAMIASCLFQWMTGENFRPSPVGADVIPALNLILIRGMEIASATASLALIWFYLIRPYGKTKEVSWDGMLLLVCLSMWIQDPIDNYFNFTFSYNAYFYNMGSWAVFLPGWSAPAQERFPEPLFLMGGMYIWFVFGFSVIGGWVLNKCRSAWLPGRSLLVHLGVVLLTMALLDFMVEAVCIRHELFAYGGTVYSLTLWAGTPYQFPLYEALLIGVLCTGLTSLRHFRDDRGISLAERGIDRMKLAKPARKFVSFLALLGFVHLFFFMAYFMPYNWFALQADSYPKMPSYLLYGSCGRGSPYACPSREVPIASRHSLAIAPDDPRLSESARRN